MSVLPNWQQVLVVVAHPDDESFGLGGVIAALVEAGAEVRVLCLTAGEASTLGASESLAQIRAEELESAARELGVRATVLRHHPDGALAARLPQLVQEVAEQVRGARPDGLLVFCAAGGVTGHPDHEAATTAALTVAVRERQRRAIAAHASQAVPGSVLWRRLELLGPLEHLRVLTWPQEAGD